MMDIDEGDDDIERRPTFSTIPTILEYEETPALAVGLKKLEDGFPETIALDVFYNPDVLIKAGLSMGQDNFPGVELAILLRLKDGKAVIPHQIFPIKSPPRILTRGLRRLRIIFPLGPVERRVLRITIPSSSIFHILFPLGVDITMDTMSTSKTSIAANIVKNYILSPSVLGVLGTPPRWRWPMVEEVARLKADLASVEKEKDDGLSKKDELAASDREKLLADAQEASPRDLDFDLNESRDDVREFTHKCGDMEVKIADLHRALDNSIEGFKKSEEYRVLLKGDTDTLLWSFC
ncbi:hypothetical protein LIER_16118 [Lithospermum erythrorhizon]|uniref:Uncharacterized protein n=1 Tax=Lithospermum erythrorhizon TaxID=34254 RepID=A0AAV3Q6W4_LITER